MAMNVLYHQTNDRLQEEMLIIEKSKLNPSYFGVIFQRYNESIFRYVVKRVQDSEIANDITSQVFVKALTALESYEFRGVPFSSWLFRIAKSEVYQYFRDNKGKHRVDIDSIKLGQMIEECEENYSEEDRARLLSVLKKLEPSQLKLIDLRFFEKRSFREIGEILGITENNAKVKTFRTVLKLKKMIKKQ